MYTSRFMYTPHRNHAIPEMVVHNSMAGTSFQVIIRFVHHCLELDSGVFYLPLTCISLLWRILTQLCDVCKCKSLGTFQLLCRLLAFLMNNVLIFAPSVAPSVISNPWVWIVFTVSQCNRRDRKIQSFFWSELFNKPQNQNAKEF
jgi:hypothetical protein